MTILVDLQPTLEAVLRSVRYGGDPKDPQRRVLCHPQAKQTYRRIPAAEERNWSHAGPVAFGLSAFIQSSVLGPVPAFLL